MHARWKLEGLDPVLARHDQQDAMITNSRRVEPHPDLGHGNASPQVGQTNKMVDAAMGKSECMCRQDIVGGHESPQTYARCRKNSKFPAKSSIRGREMLSAKSTLLHRKLQGRYFGTICHEDILSEY